MRLIHLQLLMLAGSLTACSLLNRDGPEVTCADLGDGAFNTCKNGIIAACQSGEVAYVVCEDAEACESSWQVKGAFSCVEGEPPPSTGGGGSGGSSGVGGSNSCTADGPCLVVSNDREVSAYAVTDGTLYFSDREKVLSVPVSGGFTTVLADGLAGDAEGKIAVDANHVYLLANGDGSDEVVRVPLTGGAIEILASAGSIGGIAVDDDNIFWADFGVGELRTTPKLGGAVVTASTNVYYVGKRMIVRDGYLYFAGSQAINRIPLGGPFPAAPASIPLGYTPDDFAVGPNDIFFVDGGELVARVPFSGGGLIELATNQYSAEVLTIDDSWVYYTPKYAGFPTDIKKVNQLGGSPKVVATTVVPSIAPGRIVVDGTHLYWAEGNSIWRAPK